MEEYELEQLLEPHQKGENIIPELIKLLEDEDEEVRANAAWVFGNISAEETLEPLKWLLKDTSFVAIYMERTLLLRDVTEDAIKMRKNGERKQSQK